VVKRAIGRENIRNTNSGRQITSTKIKEHIAILSSMRD
jgi:hypothetical protein